MGKDDQLILALDKGILFKESYFNGFLPAKDHNFEETILKNISWLRRGDVEKDLSKKQPIVYCMIVNPNLKKVFIYRRDDGQRYHETRLRNKLSCGVGGHIDQPDGDSENPLTYCAARELEEEVGISGEPKLLGYINEDTKGEVEKVHFGILYYTNTNEETLTPQDGEIATGEFKSIEEIEDLLKENYELEEWTKIALSALKEMKLIN